MATPHSETLTFGIRIHAAAQFLPQESDAQAGRFVFAYRITMTNTGTSSARLVSRHTVSANALLMDGVTRMDEYRYFRQKIPSSEHIPFKVENRGTPPEEPQPRIVNFSVI